MVKIEMFPAMKGDSFLVSCGEKIKTHILIDVGFPSTYRNFIKDRLHSFAANGESLALLVFTHIDEDHISGGLPLLEENGQASASDIIGIEQIWHNSYRHLQFHKRLPTLIDVKSREQLKSIIALGLPSDGWDEKNSETPISAKQGTSLAANILQGKYAWNTSFGSRAACTDYCTNIEINSEVRIRLLTPDIESLKKLEKFWRRELYKLGFKNEVTAEDIFDDAFEYLIFWQKEIVRCYPEAISYSIDNLEELLRSKFEPDTSVVNASSISFILEYEGKKVLFLADAHPTAVEMKLREMYPADAFPIHFDAIKIAHHGGIGSTSLNLLEIIDSDKYLISTDGRRYEHPDRATLARIVCREASTRRTLFFNYEHDVCSFMKNTDFMKKYNYSIMYPNQKNSLILEF